MKCGYIKANKLSNEYILRQDTDFKKEAEVINESSVLDTWINISNAGLEKESNKILKDYMLRIDLINNIIKSVIESNANGVNIDIKNIYDTENFERFIIELAPRLKEIGITVCVKMNDGIEKDNIKNVVDYIVE